MAESTCAGCRLTFTGLTSFDRHHRSTDTPPFVECVDPRDVKLEAKVRERAGRRRAVWGFPASDGTPWDGGDA